uniref:Aspartyl-tRNA synthetase 2, mitochondrial n=1 Tax=Oncorhynchus mykiss TaxID=8022 RepID=A0A8C7P3N8_ONCMY
DGQDNKKMPTGEVEVIAESVEILNVCHKLPCEIKDFVKVSRLYDYNLRLRSQLVMKIREYLCYVHGPVLPSCLCIFQGAKKFVVPSREPGRFYFLPQSPQQFKQLLMVAYFQLLIEGLVLNAWPVEKCYFSTPLPYMMYEEAMKDYGGDMPDTRFASLLMDICETFPNTEIEFLKEALNQPGSCFQAMCVPDGAVSTVKLKPIFFLQTLDLKWHSSRLLPQMAQARPGDLLLIPAGMQECVCPLLGKLGLQCAEPLEGSGMAVGNPSAFHFLWVVDFPLFLPKEDDPGQLDSAHHPFTEPLPEDTHLLHSQCEIGGGSILIHKASEQQHVLERILKDDPSLLSHLLEALDSGAPPHGGIAWVGTPSISDVIAFPKSFRGHDLVSHAPDFVSENELKPYHISVNWPADAETYSYIDVSTWLHLAF